MKTNLHATIEEKQTAHLNWLGSLDISKTQEMIHELATRLEDLGCADVTTYENGIVTAYLPKEGSEETVGLRGMYSTRAHDGTAYLQGKSQTAMLLTLAEMLQDNPGEQTATVKFVFEPVGEAIPEALTVNLKESIWQDTDVLYAASLLPNNPKNHLFISEGPAFASLDYFDIHIQGQGGHAAYPNKTVDALVIAAQIIEELQLTVSRGVNPMVPTALTVTSFEAGEGTFNIIADSAHVKGNVRTLSNEERARVEELMTDIVRNVSLSHQAEGKLTYKRMTPVLENDEALAEQVKVTFTEAFGEENVGAVSSKLTADYFATALEEKPGTVFYVGAGEEMYDNAAVDDAVLTTGVQAFLSLVTV